MIIYNNNIISDGIYHEDGNPRRWLSSEAGRYTRVYEPGNVVIDDMWPAGTAVTVANTSSVITGIMGFTGPVEVHSTVSWLTPRFVYAPPGQAAGVYQSRLTSQQLLNNKEIERKETAAGIYTDDTPYFPVTLGITVDANSGSASRTGTITFRKLGTTSTLYPYRPSTGSGLMTVYMIRITQRGSSTVVGYGRLNVSNVDDVSMSIPAFSYRVFTINVGGITTLTMDTRATHTPHTFSGIQSGSHNITITGSGVTSMGQVYKLTCTSSPSTVTIPANGSDSIKINVISAHL